MAKGDSGEMQDLINQQQKRAQTGLDTAQQQTSGLYNNMYGNYNTGAQRNFGDYGNVMGGYNSFLGGGNPGMGAQMGIGPQIGGGGPTATRSFTPGGTPGSFRSPLSNELGPGGPMQVGNSSNPGMGGVSTPQGSPGNSTDPDYIRQRVTQEMQRAGITPSGPGSGPGDVEYYVKRIGETGGWNSAADNYWGGPNGRIANKGAQAGGDSGGGINSAVGGWLDAANTGLLTEQQKSDLRARAQAPIRAAYQQASQNVDQQRGISGGYSPNYNATQAELARNQAYGMSDAATNANASIVGMQQQGQLAGLQGLTGAQLGALSGMTGLYGASPGLAGTFGNQALGANQQNLTGNALQNQLAQILLSAKLGQSQIPGNFQQALGNIGGAGNLLGGIGNMFGGGGGGNPFSFGGGGGNPGMGYPGNNGSIPGSGYNGPGTAGYPDPYAGGVNNPMPPPGYYGNPGDTYPGWPIYGPGQGPDPGIGGPGFPGYSGGPF